MAPSMNLTNSLTTKDWLHFRHQLNIVLLVSTLFLIPIFLFSDVSCGAESGLGASMSGESCVQLLGGHSAYRSLEDKVDAFWMTDQPILINGNPNLQFRFSHDTEFSVAEGLRKIGKNSAFYNELASNDYVSPLSLERALSHFKMSEKQFRAFVLRRNVKDKSPPFDMIDLQPAYMADYFQPNVPIYGQTNDLVDEVTSELLRTILIFHLRNILAANGINANNLSFDSFGTLELATNGYHITPKGLGDELNKIRAELKNTSSHIHFSTPNGAIPEDKLLEIGRIAELQVIFAMMTRNRSGNPGLADINWNHFMSGSLLAGPYSSLLPAKGISKVRYSRFKNEDGREFDDTELRHYENFEQGLMIVRNSVYLAQNYPRLVTYPQSFGDVRTQEAGNVYGALKYFSEFAGRLPSAAALAATSRALSKLAMDKDQPFSSRASLTDASYQRIHDFIVQHQLDRLVSDPDNYLSIPAIK